MRLIGVLMVIGIAVIVAFGVFGAAFGSSFAENQGEVNILSPEYGVDGEDNVVIFGDRNTVEIDESKSYSSTSADVDGQRNTAVIGEGTGRELTGEEVQEINDRRMIAAFLMMLVVVAGVGFFLFRLLFG